MDLLLHNLRTIGRDHCDPSVGEEAAEEIDRLREALKGMKRTGKEAAEVLRTEAEALRRCHTVDGMWDGTEPEVQEEYDRFMVLADLLTRPMLTPNG